MTESADAPQPAVGPQANPAQAFAAGAGARLQQVAGQVSAVKQAAESGQLTFDEQIRTFEFTVRAAAEGYVATDEETAAELIRTGEALAAEEGER